MTDWQSLVRDVQDFPKPGILFKDIAPVLADAGAFAAAVAQMCEPWRDTRLDAPHPTLEQDYMFGRPITFVHGDGSTSPGRIDLYRRGAFVLESKRLKQGTHTKGFDDALLRARSQAEGYARALSASEGRPPFVVVVDVGQRIEL